eukprot:173174-Amphidinium_carterae.1
MLALSVILVGHCLPAHGANISIRRAETITSCLVSKALKSMAAHPDKQAHKGVARKSSLRRDHLVEPAPQDHPFSHDHFFVQST